MVASTFTFEFNVYIEELVVDDMEIGGYVVTEVSFEVDETEQGCPGIYDIVAEPVTAHVEYLAVDGHEIDLDTVDLGETPWYDAYNLLIQEAQRQLDDKELDYEIAEHAWDYFEARREEAIEDGLIRGY